MRTNRSVEKATPKTHGGANASVISPYQQLERTVLSCLLWEDGGYEDGQSAVDRIKELVPKVTAEAVASLAISARNDHNLRHVSLLLLRELCRHPGRDKVRLAKVIENVIQRADEPAEFLAMYFSDGKQPLTRQVKTGLGMAMRKFNAYQLAKYNTKRTVTSRDVLRLIHPVPSSEQQSEDWKGVIENSLPIPDTWETALSAGADKKETFTRLIEEGKLGYFALLRNLRGMIDAGVSKKLLKEAILARQGGAEKLHPFRFITAAKHAPTLVGALDKAMLAGLEGSDKLPGRTVIVVDVSGSMYSSLSSKSELSRYDAASAFAAITKELCEDCVIYATGGDDYARKHRTVAVAGYRGLALAKEIVRSGEKTGQGGIFLKQVMDFVAKEEEGDTVDRVIVITDEQDCSFGSADSPEKAKLLGRHNYIINVAANKNGIAYKKWTHINGFSETAVRYISTIEKGNLTDVQKQLRNGSSISGKTLAGAVSVTEYDDCE